MKNFSFEELYDMINQVQEEMYQESEELSNRNLHTTPGDVKSISKMVCDRLKGKIMNGIVESVKDI